MKQRVIIIFVAISLIALLCSCQAGGTNGQAGETSANANAPAAKPAASVDQKAVVNDVREVLAQHDKALNDKNIDAVMATFSNDLNTVVLGTGTEERWQGPEEIRAAYTEIFKDYDAGTLTANCDWKTGGTSEGGTMAWLAASCACKDSHAGKPREYKLNVTAALQKQADGKWRFAALHMSNAFQPPVTK